MGCDATIDNIVVVGKVIFVSLNVVVGQCVVIGLIIFGGLPICFCWSRCCYWY